MFQITDVPRVLPEILLVVLALLVLGSDIFEKWKNTPESRIERAQAAGSLTAIGLGMVFAIALLQSGYLYTLPADAPSNPLTNLVRNLQAGGPGGAPIAGAFATDDLTMIARLILIGAAFLTALLAYDYRPAGNPAEFYALILASTAGMGLMAGASDLIVAFLAVELTSIPLYVLAGYFRNDQRSSEAGMKYLLFGALSSGILLYGMSLAYGAVVTSLGSGAAANSVTNFATIAQAASGTAEIPALLTLAMVFMIAGIGYKIAVVPFHGWSPDVYQGAPTPVTAFIATASKAAGFILLFRLLASGFPGLEGSALIGSDFGGWTSLLALMAALTLVIGNLAALPQTNIKRLLAYSSIAHAGFILLGLVAWADPQAFDRSQATSALIYYVIVYVITNIGAFGALAAVGLAVGGEEQRDVRGLAQRNLPLALFFAICLLSLAGIPPLAGFFAKFYVFMVAWQVGAYELVILALVTTVISLYYYLRLLKAMFIEAPETSEPVALPRSTAGALITAVVLLLVIGIFPNLLLGILSRINLLATGL